MTGASCEYGSEWVVPGAVVRQKLLTVLAEVQGPAHQLVERVLAEILAEGRMSEPRPLAGQDRVSRFNGP